jgi:16S rRNA (uracil1498-N3)-methyltransferase
LNQWAAASEPGWYLNPKGEDSLHDLPESFASIVLAIGPEGGLAERDLAILKSAGFRGLRLGPRILRTETAGLAAIAAIQAMRGDLG